MSAKNQEIPVRLYESNAGFLYLAYARPRSRPEVTEDVSGVSSIFADDAQALMEGDTENWTVEITNDTVAIEHRTRPDELIAEWTYSGGVHVLRQPGSAGRKYLGEEVMDKYEASS